MSAQRAINTDPTKIIFRKWFHPLIVLFPAVKPKTCFFFMTETNQAAMGTLCSDQQNNKVYYFLHLRVLACLFRSTYKNNQYWVPVRKPTVTAKTGIAKMLHFSFRMSPTVDCILLQLPQRWSELSPSLPAVAKFWLDMSRSLVAIFYLPSELLHCS